MNSDTTYYIKEKIKFCNILNSGTIDGIGNNSENIDETQTKWKLYKVHNRNDKFKLLDSELDYHIIHTKLREKGRPLVVIPGYSDKSICWTLGEMNRYITHYPDCFMEYNDVYLFNLEEVKKIQDKNKDKREDLDIQISIHINDILHELKLKNISLLGRSAGGGICIRVAKMSLENDFIFGLNLACPGYKKEGIMDFIEARIENPIPIRFCWAIEDTTVPISQGYQMKQQLIDSGYIKKGKNLLKFVEISTNSEKASVNHRVHKELITMLI